MRSDKTRGEGHGGGGGGGIFIGMNILQGTESGWCADLVVNVNKGQNFRSQKFQLTEMGRHRQALLAVVSVIPDEVAVAAFDVMYVSLGSDYL